LVQCYMGMNQLDEAESYLKTLESAKADEKTSDKVRNLNEQLERKRIKNSKKKKAVNANPVPPE
ncbi:hypothetical protein ACFL5V_13775, partial [Fibrobacterota bacterium]